jgi:hypothetical protein
MNNGFDDLDELERELGDTVRVALRKVAKTVADDQRPMGSGHGSSAGEVFLTVDAENTANSRPPLNRRVLVGVGILAAAAVAGIALVVSSDNEISPADEPNQTVPAAPVQLTEHVLTDVDSVEVTLSLPPGWDGDGFAVGTDMEVTNDAFISVWEVTHVYSDPCQWQGTLEEVGPTVDDLAAALEQQPMRDATVSAVEVDGFAGKLVTMSVSDDMVYDESASSSDGFVDCDLGRFMTWNNPAGNNVRLQQGPGQRDDVYILDVNGTRVVVNVAYFPDLPQPQLGELESIVQSMRIRSVYVLGPTADSPGQVTFTVPEGWDVGADNTALLSEMGGREIYIMIWDITHVYADPCHWEGTLEEVGPTVDDLAAALAQQPMRDATVSDVELDGFAGKLVRMSVPDDIPDDFADCDRGQFMTSNNPAGSNVRNQQGPGQRDDVYILDVNGTRLELDVAYYPDLPQADLDEIESIVHHVRIDPPEASEPPATTESQPGN